MDWISAGELHEECGGIYARTEPCRCHVSPPCSACTSGELECLKCGFVLEQDDGSYIPPKPLETIVKSSIVECVKIEVEQDDGLTYYVEQYFDCHFDRIVGRGLSKANALALKKRLEHEDYIDYIRGRGLKLKDFYVKLENEKC